MVPGLVSVVMPIFNAQDVVSDAITSVLCQSYSNLELIICDDFSTDESKSLVESFSKADSRVKLVINTFGKGAAGARNSCLQNACGQYIAFLDADDMWKIDKLEKQIFYMKTHRIYFCYSYYDNLFPNGQRKIVKSPDRVNFKLMRFNNWVGCLTVVLDAAEFRDINQPSLKKRNDYAYWLKLLYGADSSITGCVPESLAVYRVSSGGLSSNKIHALYYYVKCIREFGRVRVEFLPIFILIYLAILFIKKSSLLIYNKMISGKIFEKILRMN
jgi:glycosyltransferase involved in cell wall biosynthesis